jgi:hypothetical protein
MPSLRTQIPIPPNITGVVWQPYTGYQQYRVKCGCTTSMGTACRRWAIGFRDETAPVCQAHFTPTPLLPPAAIERRRDTAANQRVIRHTASVTNRIAGIVTTINMLRATITPDMPLDQTRSVYNRIVVLHQHIERIRVESVVRFAITVPPYSPAAPTEPLAEEKLLVEDECPICMEDYVVSRKAPCGHHACPGCCLQMHAAGRTLKCPLCRDTGFRRLVSYAVSTPVPVMT